MTVWEVVVAMHRAYIDCLDYSESNIDAADNNGVDTLKKIRENVYLIDWQWDD